MKNTYFITWDDKSKGVHYCKRIQTYISVEINNEDTVDSIESKITQALYEKSIINIIVFYFGFI